MKSLGEKSARARHDRARAAVQRRKAESGWLEVKDVAERWGRSPYLITQYYLARGLLRAEWFETNGTFHWLIDPESMLETEAERHKSPEFRAGLDVEERLSELRKRGTVDRLVRAGMSFRDAEDMLRGQADRSRELFLAYQTKKPGRPELEWKDEWARALITEFEATAADPITGKARSLWELCQSIAHMDFEFHPERWMGFSSWPGDPTCLHEDELRRAGNRVWRAVRNHPEVKALQTALQKLPA